MHNHDYDTNCDDGDGVQVFVLKVGPAQVLGQGWPLNAKPKTPSRNPES